MYQQTVSSAIASVTTIEETHNILCTSPPAIGYPFPSMAGPSSTLRIAPALLLGLILLAPPPARADEPAGPWALTVYWGRGTDGGIEEVPGHRADFLNAYMLAVAPSRVLQKYGDRAELAIEGQVAKHWNYQDHWEFNGLFVARWLAFPWDVYLDTSLAVGEGLSYASQVPQIEILRSPDATSRLLNYVLVEADLRPAFTRHWSLNLRLHHRSGALGLFDGVHRGSNILCAGLKYRF